MPVVWIPPPYRGPTQGAAEISVAGRTVLDCLQSVEDRYPGFLAFVLDDGGRIQRFVKLFVNEEQLIDTVGLGTQVSEDDRVDIISAIAGG